MASPRPAWARSFLSLISVILAANPIEAAPTAAPACTGCLLSAGLEIVSYPAQVQTTVVATEVIVPILYVYNGSTWETTSTIFPTQEPNGTYATDLTWTIPSLTDVTL
jgi:hypothetical protein